MKRFLQKHFELFNTMDHDTQFPFPISNDGVRIKYKGIGYNWQSWQSGMDNTPRKRVKPLFWKDAISQQALYAVYQCRRLPRPSRQEYDAAVKLKCFHFTPQSISGRRNRRKQRKNPCNNNK